MHEIDDDTGSPMPDGDVCGDYDLSEPAKRLTVNDFKDVLPIWWVRAEDYDLTATEPSSKVDDRKLPARARG